MLRLCSSFCISSFPNTLSCNSNLLSLHVLPLPNSWRTVPLLTSITPGIPNPKSYAVQTARILTKTQITQRLLFRLQNPVRSSVFSAPMRTAPYCTASLRRKMKMKMKLAKKVKEKPSPQFFFSLQRIEESLSLSQKK